MVATLVGALLGSCAESHQSGVSSGRMRLIRQRGHLICGVEGSMPGFSRVTADGRYTGLDVDLCRAVAAALLGDGEKVEFHNLTASERFAALASGQNDLLARNTTFTLSRDATGGNALTFGPIVYYDAQGFLVPRGSGIRHPADLSGRPICVVSGTTTELNLADWMRSQSIPYRPLKFQAHDQSYAAYLQERCAAVTSSQALLAAQRSTFSDPMAHTLLDEAISKEPNAPVTRQEDPAWADAVRWTVYGLIQAEELGLTRNNLNTRLEEARRQPQRAGLRRFLGVEGDFGTQLGLNADFMVRALKSVGNYGDCLLYTSPSPRDATLSRMPSSA